MKKYYEILQSTGIFVNVAESDFSSLLECLGARVKSVKRSETVLLAGDRPHHVGIVLEGMLHIAREDIDGARAIIAAALPGELFAEALCCAHVTESPVTVAAERDSTVLLLPFERILGTCCNACPFHSRLIENMLGLIAKKNLILQRRMDIISQRSIRARVLRYLSPLVKKHGEAVQIPFNREEMADFLCVERTALSHELSRMKKDGLIDYSGRRFIIK